MLNVDIIGKLIPNPITLLVQLCSTAVLFFLAKKFLWKSVLNWMTARTDRMQTDLAERRHSAAGTAGSSGRKKPGACAD